MVGGQWIRINKEDMPYYFHARCLKNPDQVNGPESGPVRFRKRLERARQRKGSPLKHEYKPEANMFWRFVEVDGQMKWIEKDWSLEPPLRIGGFSDSGDSDDDYLEIKQTAKGSASRTEHRAVKTLAPEEASAQSRDAARQEIPQQVDVPWKQVPLGGETLSFDDQAERKVSFGSTTITEIPEDFVTIVDKEKAQEIFAAAIDDGEESEDEIYIFDKPERQDHDPEWNEQPVDGRGLATTAEVPKATKPRRQTTIKFAPVTIVKESPANHLPTLEYFPDFCTASKPIFRPDRQRQTDHAVTLATFSESVKAFKPFTDADSEGLNEGASMYAIRRRSPLQEEVCYGEDCEESGVDEVEQAPSCPMRCGSDGMERPSRRRMLRSCEY
ncbi:hypothetical protein EPUS_05448 [Endocarpon pusillum Z07020]|uniref:Uncharacterized protein n=1 Tax=Endocarpon pusillum (strain Z07020 / HMAS-L-300199) TaxID=1263415 RepID=U1HLL7_ENDPU|nr:uncharacterized protein EPUS_05448 [Endocarpon pusillum Z07020]ERF69904.1 hypothetical protein EPUS_05448 [Endocarpon pusillum Z07020]